MSRQFQIALALLAALSALSATGRQTARADELPVWRPYRPSDEYAGADERSSDRPGRARRYPTNSGDTAATSRPYDERFDSRADSEQFDRWRNDPYQRRNIDPYSRRNDRPADGSYRTARARGANWRDAPAGEAGYDSRERYEAGPDQNFAPDDRYRTARAYGQAPMYAPNDGFYAPGGYSSPDMGFDPGDGYGPGSGYGGGFADQCGSGCGNACGGCNSCGGGCGWGLCNPCRGPIYARGEYLGWWLTGDTLPPLVTTAPSTTPRATAGVLGQPTTSVLYGDDAVNNQYRNGGRVVLGWWLSPSTRIEGEWFGLASVNSQFQDSSSGSPIITRPFFNLRTGLSDSNVIAYPGQRFGSVAIRETSNFLGAGINATKNIVCNNWYCDRSCRLDFLSGFRYVGLYETFTADSKVTSIDPQAAEPVGTIFTTSDSFSTSNNFFGADVGLSAQARAARWCLTGVGRLGIGGTVQHVNIAGGSTATVPTLPTVASAGGLYAMPTNIGSYNHTGFTLLPQLELKIGYDLSPAWRVTFGYDVLYWSRVVRPGQQLDLFVNPSQSAGQPLVGTPGPRFAFHETDLWVQGISTGLECRF